MNIQPTLAQSDARPTRKQITTAYDDMTEAGRAWYSGRRAKDSFQLRKQYENAVTAYETLALAARIEFGKSHGWRYNRKTYMSDYAALDHADVYEDAKGEVAGVITHSYAGRERIQLYAAEHDMLATFLPWSWHAPDIATAVLLTPKAP